MSSTAHSHDRSNTSPVRVARAAVIAPIFIYQRVISPAIPRRCKYEPTCSRYAIDAVRRYGILRGLALAGWRLLRCNPWSHGGYDPVESQRVFDVGPTTQDRVDMAGSLPQSHSVRATDPRGPRDSPAGTL